MGFAKYHEDDIRIFDDRMYYRNVYMCQCEGFTFKLSE